MKLEVGMYVRTKHNGIGKIVEYINDPTHYFYKCYKLDRDCDNCEEYITKADVIEEPSHNIIDLIEVGDYVNGYKVSFKDNDYKPFVQCDYPVQEGTTNHYRFYEEAICSIVTKEQYESMAYKVGE